MSEAQDRGSLDDILACRPQMERALAHAEGTHTFADVLHGILSGRMQFWRSGRSVLVTQIVDYPRKRVAFVFLAAGERRDIQMMESDVAAWAVAQGCTEAQCLARMGWARTFMQDTGWRAAPLLVLRKTLVGGE